MVCFWFSSCSERFLTGFAGFPFSLKTNNLKFQFDPESESVLPSVNIVLFIIYFYIHVKWIEQGKVHVHLPVFCISPPGLTFT